MTASRALVDLVAGKCGRPGRLCPARRRCIDLGGVGGRLRGGRARSCALWVDGDLMRMALSDGEQGLRAVSSLKTEAGAYPSVGRHHAPALRLERAMRDLYGTNRLACRIPGPGWTMAAGRVARTRRYEFLPAEGEGLHQIPVGPVHAGIIEPGHFRFTANGETVVRLEERLGYVHKGVEDLFAGADIERGARLVGRLSGDSTVAYAWAYARAVEAALGWPVPPRGDLVARHHGRAGAHGAPHQRCRRDLQRCQRDRHPRPMRAAARGRPGDVAGLLRPSPDDGLHRARRRHCRSVERWHRPGPQPARPPGGDARRDPAGLRLDAVAAGSHRHDRHRLAGAGPPVCRRRLRRPRIGPRLRRAQDFRLYALRSARTSASGRARPATSMPACWCVWTRSRKAFVSSASCSTGWRRARSAASRRRSRRARARPWSRRSAAMSS